MSLAAKRDQTYESFSQAPEIYAVDSELASLATPAGRILDIGTGTGAMFQHLRDRKLLIEPVSGIGIDPDEAGLAIARDKFKEYGPGSPRGTIRFETGDAETLEGIADDSMDLIIAANMTHLLDNLGAFYHRIYRAAAGAGRTAHGGPSEVLVSSAYESSTSWPRMSLVAMHVARKLTAERIEQQYGLTSQAEPANLLRYSKDQHIQKAEEAGFKCVEARFSKVLITWETLRKIGSYTLYAKGLCPDINPEQSGPAIVDIVDDIADFFRQRGRDIGGVEVNWFLMKAVKE